MTFILVSGNECIPRNREITNDNREVGKSVTCLPYDMNTSNAFDLHLLNWDRQGSSI